MFQICKRYLLERYKIFNNGNNEESIYQVNTDYIRSMREILNVDPQKYEQQEQEIITNKEYNEKQEVEIQSLIAEISVSILHNYFSSDIFNVSF